MIYSKIIEYSICLILFELTSQQLGMKQITKSHSQWIDLSLGESVFHGIPITVLCLRGTCAKPCKFHGVLTDEKNKVMAS